MNNPRLAACVEFPQLGWRFTSTAESIVAGGKDWRGGGRCELMNVASDSTGSYRMMSAAIRITNPKEWQQIENTPSVFVRFHTFVYNEPEDDWGRIPNSLAGVATRWRYSGGVAVADVEVSPFLVKPAPIHWSDEDQYLRHPGDRGLEYLRYFARNPYNTPWPELDNPGDRPTAVNPARPPLINLPPVILNPGSPNVFINEEITPIDIVVTDVNRGDVVTVSLSTLPTGLVFDAVSRQITGTPTDANPPGSFGVTINATDNIEGNAPQTLEFFFNINAARANRPPVITNPGRQEVRQGQTVNLPIAITNDRPANEEAVTSRVDTDKFRLPRGLRYEQTPTGGRIVGTVASTAARQRYTIRIYASDGVNAEVFTDFDIVVSGANSAARYPYASDSLAFVPKNVTRLSAMTPYSVLLGFLDNTNPPEITVAVTGLPPGITHAYSATTRHITFSGTPTAAARAIDNTAEGLKVAPYRVRVEITAGDVSTVAYFTIAVIREGISLSDLPPVFASDTLSATGSANTIVDTPTPVDVTFTTNAPDGITEATTDSSITFTGTPRNPGVYPVEIGIEDAHRTVTATVFMTNSGDRAAIPSDTGSRLSVGNNVSLFRGQLVSAPSSANVGIPISAVNQQGDPQAATVAGLPSGLSYSFANRGVTGTVGETAAYGVYEVTATYDRVVKKFTISILERPSASGNQPPIISITGLDASYPRNGIMNATVVVDDPEGLPVTVRVSFEGLFTGLSYNELNGQVTGRITPTHSGPPATGTIVVTADDGVNPAVTSRFNFQFQQGQTTVTPRPTPTPTPTRPTPPTVGPTITLSGGFNTSFEQGASIAAISLSGSHSGGLSVSLSVSGLPTGLSFSRTTNQITGTVSETARVGIHTVTISGSATDGTSATRSFIITITRKEDPDTPVTVTHTITGGDNNVSYEQGETITPIPISATASNGEAVTITVTGLPTGLRWNASAGRIEGTVATSAGVRNYTIAIATTSASTSDIKGFVFTVTRRIVIETVSITLPQIVVYGTLVGAYSQTPDRLWTLFSPNPASGITRVTNVTSDNTNVVQNGADSSGRIRFTSAPGIANITFQVGNVVYSARVRSHPFLGIYPNRRPGGITIANIRARRPTIILDGPNDSTYEYGAAGSYDGSIAVAGIGLGSSLTQAVQGAYDYTVTQGIDIPVIDVGGPVGTFTTTRANVPVGTFTQQISGSRPDSDSYLVIGVSGDRGQTVVSCTRAIPFDIGAILPEDQPIEEVHFIITAD